MGRKIPIEKRKKKSQHRKLFWKKYYEEKRREKNQLTLNCYSTAGSTNNVCEAPSKTCVWIEYPNDNALLLLASNKPLDDPETSPVRRQHRLEEKKKPLQETQLANPIRPAEYHENNPVEEGIDRVTVLCNCRLCLKEITSSATPIWGDSGIYEKVLRCSSVEVLETDLFQFVCLSCKQHLDYINKFQQMCLESNEIFLNISVLKEENPLPNSLNQDEIFDEQPTEDKKQIEENLFLGGEERDDTSSNFGSEGVNTSNIGREDEIENEYPCAECPMVSFQEEDYHIHQRSHEKQPSKRIAQIDILCSFCGKTFQKNPTFLVHMRTHNDRPRECGECGKVLSGIVGFKAHQRVHLPTTPIICKLCGSKFRLKNSLTHHTNTVHNQKPKSSCHYCDRKFSCPYNMRVHLRTHTGEEPYSCPDCKLSFAHRVTMKLHRLKQHKVNMFDHPSQKYQLERKKRRNKKSNAVPSQIA